MQNLGLQSSPLLPAYSATIAVPVVRPEMRLALRSKSLAQMNKSPNRTKATNGGKMAAAEATGINGKDLAVALMDVAKADGGMRA
jgi:hypothetical protein